MIAKNVIKTYPNGYTALKGVSFETPESGFICITGESGSGKTTLLNCLFGAEECEGKIVICGEEMTNKNRDELRRKYMTMIYQDYRLIEDMTVEDNLRLAGNAVGINLTDDDILNALAKVGLKTEYKENKVSAMSGGEKQRVGIARAIIQKSKVLLADEPTGNLDSRNSRAIFELLKELSKELLIIAVTHNATLADEFADYSITMMDGEIAKTNLVNIKLEDKEKCANNNLERKDNSQNIINENETLRKTKISRKMFFTLVRQTGKGKAMTILLSIFSIVFLVLSFITSSLMTANEEHITKINLQRKAESLIYLSGGFAFSQNSFKDIDCEKFYVFPDGSTLLEIDWSLGANMSATYVKDHRTDITKYVVECNDVSKLGVTLLCGRNAENYDEIVVNESVAYECLSGGEVLGKKINSYEDVLGLERSGLKIVGIASARFEKYDGAYKNATNQDYLNADVATQYLMEQAKEVLTENIESQINFVKEGYSEYTRNTYDTINASVRAYTLAMKDIIMPPSDYNIHNGQEYNDISGQKTTAMLAENEIVISSTAWQQYIMINGKPTEPFEHTFMLDKTMDYKLRVVGYSDKIYVGEGTAQLLKNTGSSIFNALALSSKIKASDRARIDKVFNEKLPLGNEFVAITPFTNGLHDTATTLEDFRVMFIVAFAVSVALLILFNFFSVYVIMKQRKKDILTMRSISVGESAMSTIYATAFGALSLIQIILSFLVYAVAVFGINQLIKTTSFVLFDFIFVEALPSILVSVVSVASIVLIAIRYLAVLYSKTIGYRMKH